MAVKTHSSAKGAMSVKGHTTKQKVQHAGGGEGTEPEIEYFEWLVDYGSTDVPTCNVNVNLGARIGLPDYSDVRFGASLTVPCAPSEPAVEQAYGFAKGWCMTKMEELREELLDG